MQKDESAMYNMRILDTVIIGCTLIASGCVHQVREAHLIPSGFTGRVCIFFDQADGAPPKFEGSHRLYEIPDDGLLFTQFGHQDGYFDEGSMHFFSLDSTEGRKKLKWVASSANIASEEVHSVTYRIGVFGPENVHYLEYFVGGKTAINRLMLENEKVSVAELYRNRVRHFEP